MNDRLNRALLLVPVTLLLPVLSVTGTWLFAAPSHVLPHRGSDGTFDGFVMALAINTLLAMALTLQNMPRGKALRGFAASIPGAAIIAATATSLARWMEPVINDLLNTYDKVLHILAIVPLLVVWFLMVATYMYLIDRITGHERFARRDAAPSEDTTS